MNIDKLSPAPWTEGEHGIVDGNGESVYCQTGRARDDFGDDDLEFVLLARNAFDGDQEALAWWEENRKRPLTPADRRVE